MKLIPARLIKAAWDVFEYLKPPKKWQVPVLLAGGSFVGIALLVFHISNASSYLLDDPKACINCHIMAPQYATWQHSSHGRVATCNDCHVPHENVFMKYAFKAFDGSRHAFMFTFHMEPQVIKIHEPGQWVVQNNCIRCHSKQLGDATSLKIDLFDVHQGKGKLCWECHRETPHGRVNSLAAVPQAQVPQLSPVVPDWIQEKLKKKETHETNR